MSIGAISSLGSYVTALLGANKSTSGHSATDSTDASSLSIPNDNSQLSPFAQLMNTLQQLQESDPTKYQQVTQQIAGNLQKAASTAQADGKPTLATGLNQLATDFTSASQSGQLPSVKDLAQAVQGGHHHGHHHGGGSGISQLLSALDSNATASASSGASDSLNPMSIISSTLTDSGVTS
jgi:hypothetical protein